MSRFAPRSMPAAGPRTWRGHSDTETLIEAIALWGLKRALEKCVGMFALALWDRKERSLLLARDRFGEKPLYYGWVGGDFLFGSELKALRSHPGFDNEIDTAALRLLASRTYIPAPLSIYRHIYKLEPGCILAASTDVPRQRPSSAPVGRRRRPAACRSVRYWSYRDAVTAGLARSPTRRGGGAGHARADPCGRDPGPVDGGRAGRRLPVGRHRFLDRRRALPEIFESAGAHLLDRLRGSRLQRGRICQGRRARISAPSINERYVTVQEAQEVIPLASRPSMTSRSPIPRRSRLIWSAASPASRSRWRCPATAATSCSAAITAISARARLWSSLRRLPRPAAGGDRRRLRLGAGRRLGRARPACCRASGGRRISAPRCARAFGLAGAGGARGCVRELPRRMVGRGLRRCSAQGERSGSLRLRPGARPGRARRGADDVLRRGRLSARRHTVQGRPRGDGGQPRNPRPLPRPSGRRAGRSDPDRDEDQGRQGQAYPSRSCSIAKRRERCSNGPRPASRFRSANGSRARCATGRRNCSTEKRLREEGYFDAGQVRRRWERASLGPTRLRLRRSGRS